MYVELHARSAFSFLQGASLPEEYADAAAKFDLPGDGPAGSRRRSTAPRASYAAMKKAGMRAHIGAEVLCTDGARYPLLVKNRTGYQNLCRLITRTKLRTEKHPKPGQEAAATPEELAEFAEGLICLTGDGDGPLALALRKGRRPRLPGTAAAHLRPRQCLCRTAAASRSRRRSAQPGRRRAGAQSADAAGRHQRRLPRAPRAARSARCLHLPAPQSDARQRRPPARRTMPSGI